MFQVILLDGTSVFLDIDYIQQTYQPVALRVTSSSQIEILVHDEEGILVWIDISEAETNVGTRQ